MSVLLNQQDCTANLDFSEDGLTAQPFVSEVLCRFWSGVRGNASALTGKLKFAVTITEVLQEDDSVHEVLIGLSSRSTDVAQLGTGNSYAFSSSGEKWTASKAEAFGRAFGVGDKVWCFLDLDSDVCTVSFAVNQNWLGAAFDIVRPARTQSALFPHILVRNFKVQVDFEGQNVEADWPAEAASFQPWPTCSVTGNVAAPAAATKSASDCEVLVMVGLPGCGKSTWATRYKANHADRGYNIVSIDGLIKQLKIGHVKTRGKPKAPDTESQQLAEQAFEELLQHMATVPCNYILDDSNVYQEARLQRILKFKQSGFRTRAAVIVLPDSSLFRRQRKQHQEDGKSVPDTTIADMRANFSMPEVGDVFQEVLFVEAKPPEANDIAADQAEAAREALPKLRARQGRQTRSKVAKGSTPPAKPRKPAASKAAKGAASARAGSPAPVKEEDVAGKAAAEAQQSTEPAAVTDNTSPTTSMLSKEQPAAADTDQLATDSQDVHVVASQDGAPGSPTQVETAAEVIDEGKPLVLAAEPAEASVEAAIQADAVAVTALPESPAVSLEAAEGIEVEDADVSQGMSQEPKKQASDTVEQDDIALAVEGDASGSPEPMEIAATVAATADEVQPSTDHQEPAVNAAANKVITAVTGSDTAAAPTDMEVDTEGAIAPADEPQAKPADAPASPVAVIKPEPISGDEPAGDESVPTAAPAADESGKSDPKDAKASDAEAHSHSPAGPDKQDVGKASGTESSARGIKRSAPAVPVARGAKLARTSQAAGRLVGNIRAATTVKRTVFKGRAGVRQTGLRLPPPIQKDGVPVSVKPQAEQTTKAEPAAADGAAAGQDHTETSAKVANIKDVMQKLLPVEEDKGKAEPGASKAIPNSQAKQGNAKEAKPGPAAQKRDQGGKAASQSRAADKRCQDRKPQDSSRLHQEEQITRNILASWQVQRSMHSEVKKVLEMAKRKKRNERVVRLVDAAARGDITEVNIVLSSNDVEVDDGDYHQRTALHLAASNGHIAMVRHLVLIHGANMNVLDRYNGSPIMDAVRHKHSEVVAFLKRNGAVLHHDKAKGSLFKACVDGDFAYTELLINNGMPPNTCDYNQRTPLHLAASNGHTHIVHFLCNQPGVQLNAVDGVGNTPLMDAIRHSHKEVQAALRLAGANLSAVNVADKLCLAAAENDTATLEVLMKNGVDVNAADTDQRTALHVAASRGRAEVAFFLLNTSNVDVNPLDRWGATPLQDAYLSGDKVMCALLERAGGKKSDDPAIREKLPALLIRQQQDKVERRRDKVLRIVKACQEVAAAAQLQQVCAGVQSHVPDVEQSCIMLQYMLQEVADLGISGVAWSPAKDEMEALLGKACKQAISSLGHMAAELRAEASQRVCGVPITRMLCPGLLQQLNTALACLETIPVILERTMQIGRENEFYFEDWEKRQAQWKSSLQHSSSYFASKRHNRSLC